MTLLLRPADGAPGQGLADLHLNRLTKNGLPGTAIRPTAQLTAV